MSTLQLPVGQVVSSRPNLYTIDFERAVEITSLAVRHYQNRSGPYGRGWQLPEDAALDLPEAIRQDPVQMARFWFWSCMFMRGRIKSKHAITRLARLYTQEAAAGRPDLLDPDVGRYLRPDYINQVLAKYALSRYGSGWVRNAELLVGQYGGNPTRIFDGLISSGNPFEAACRRLCNRPGSVGGGFWGFQKKMASMLIYYLEVAQLIDPFPFPPPVDFHHVRIALSTGIIDLHGHVLQTVDELEYGLLDDLRRVYLVISQESGTPTVMLAQAIWLLSSYLCTETPGNALTERGAYDARQTKLIYQLPDWSKASPAAINSYLRSCGTCPLEHLCQLWVPSGQWYDHGVVGSMLFPRTRPDLPVLFNPYQLAGSAAR